MEEINTLFIGDSHGNYNGQKSIFLSTSSPRITFRGKKKVPNSPPKTVDKSIQK
jgi:hypothetical protein